MLLKNNQLLKINRTSYFILGIFLFLLFASISFAQPKIISIIPKPQSIKQVQGNFAFSKTSTFFIEDESLKDEFSFLESYLKTNFEITIELAKEKSTANIILSKINNDKHLEGFYTLTISPSQIQISGDEAGNFYAIQNIIQLLPTKKDALVKIPCVVIEDYPRYNWRGMHLDVCRHFFTKEEVKKYIDYLAMYKLNTFHWHLTEDQGWRIEIKKYPLLTQVGSIRKETLIGKPRQDAQYDGKFYGGFYTQEDIKEVVAYAQQRHITIVPEIEMPGHSLAALSAYHQFSCNQKPLSPAVTWGVFDDVYCAGNDSTFQFLENILDEVCELFPSKIIHIGGDECPKERWKTCSKCQKRIKENGLKDEHELQSYFISRIEKYLNSKGRQIIGWDEILEGGLAPNASVMSWRGTDGGIAAAKQKHNVVMSPGKPCYFDHYQTKNKLKEPLAIGGYNPLDSVYAYNPTPKILSADEQQYILGAQANVWTEYIPTFKNVEYMSMPRMAAISEVLWTLPENKNYNNFVQRLKIHSKLLDKMNVNYAKHFLNNK